MEWNRGQGQDQPAAATAARPAVPAATTTKKNNGLAFWKSLRIAQVVLLFSVTALIVAVVWFLALGGNGKTESGFVDKKKLQAVFLNGGQVYFGNINDLNGKFLSMNNIYYLRVNQQVQPNQDQSAASNDISLVKLGCELHGPTDNMVINREQIIFWENLKDDGQVAKAVADYRKQNPDGQKCDTENAQSSNTGTTNNSATTNSTNNTTNTTTTPTTNTNTTNKKTTNQQIQASTKYPALSERGIFMRTV